MSQFVTHLKSTIDYHALQTAKAAGVAGVELDDSVNVEEVLKQAGSAVVWQLLDAAPAPRDPMYLGTFSVGIKVTDDPGNTLLFSLLENVQDRFQVGASVLVMDYEGEDLPIENLGYVYFTGMRLDSQQHDRQMDFRLWEVEFRALRKP